MHQKEQEYAEQMEQSIDSAFKIAEYIMNNNDQSLPANEIEKICGDSFKVFGIHISTMNSHWLKKYGEFLIFLSKIDMKETVSFADFETNDNTEEVGLVDDMFVRNDFYVEGYKLRDFTELFISYCKCYHENNKQLAEQAKLKRIAELEKELKELKR